MARMIVCMFVILCVMSCTPAADDKPYDWQLRKGFPKPFIPEDNPITLAKVELGRHLFYDKRLSGNSLQACASCHIQEFAFSEPQTTSTGSTGEAHRRNSLALINVAYNKSFTWAHDQLTSLERQLLIPMFGDNPIELGMAGKDEEILTRINQDTVYQGLTQRAFGDETLTMVQVVNALASFVRSLTSFNSPFDRYAYDMADGALSKQALKGMALFFSEKLECHHCHGGFNFTQSTVHEKQPLDRRPFHNTGLYNVSESGYPSKDKGLREITLNPKDDGRFRAPTLRNIEVTAPYMHDGSIKTLSEVIDFYAAGGRRIDDGQFAGDGRAHKYKSQFVQGFDLSDEEKAALIVFLRSLTDETFLHNPLLSNPWQKKEHNRESK